MICRFVLGILHTDKFFKERNYTAPIICTNREKDYCISWAVFEVLVKHNKSNHLCSCK